MTRVVRSTNRKRIRPCVTFLCSTGIPEDLAQVQYVLTDKTGTLTENVMLLKKCGVRGCAYGEATGDLAAGERQACPR